MANTLVTQKPAIRTKNLTNYLKRYWMLYLLLLLPFAYIVVFKYIPLLYVQIAFKKYNITMTPWEMEWAGNFGFEYFIKAFQNRDFLYSLRNTVMLNFLGLIVGFPAPVILALILNELAFKRYKKFTQTVVYLPHFLSWIIISGMAKQLFAPTSGLVNILLIRNGMESIPFLDSSPHWVGMYLILGIWKEMGWGTIIYLAALTAISPELYEAAAVDGASRLRRIWHITLPGIRSTIIVLLIMNLGHILGGDFERNYSLGNKLVSDVYRIIGIFVFENGIRAQQFSLATAVGLFQSFVGVFFVLGANTLASKFGERGLS